MAPDAGPLVAALRVARTAVAVATRVRVLAARVDAIAAALPVRRRAGAATPRPIAASALLATPSLGPRAANVLLRRAVQDVGRPA